MFSGLIMLNNLVSHVCVLQFIPFIFVQYNCEFALKSLFCFEGIYVHFFMFSFIYYSSSHNFPSKESIATAAQLIRCNYLMSNFLIFYIFYCVFSSTCILVYCCVTCIVPIFLLFLLYLKKSYILYETVEQFCVSWSKCKFACHIQTPWCKI